MNVIVYFSHKLDHNDSTIQYIFHQHPAFQIDAFKPIMKKRIPSNHIKCS